MLSKSLRPIIKWENIKFHVKFTAFPAEMNTSVSEVPTTCITFYHCA